MITHDRWLRIKEIFQSAREIKTPAERLDFLTQVCGDDKLLREEVEALLSADESNDDFLNIPALKLFEGAWPDETTENNEFSPDQKVGHYTILCPLGAGGMGQIYLAQDEKLGRKIALKFIAREFATDARRVHRFEQEARAVSSLNHPNVCVIHETGVTENYRRFIAMEYIQGETLRDKLTRETLTPLEAIQIAVQVAAALASAHAAGIVHRDIKPENIMVRPDSYVKVLDFGLAKLTERVPEETRGASPAVKTEAGMLMGTVKYMSPEQLREAELDERTDIWSLGVVLYEMLTRTTPFEAHTPNDTIALILGPQTPPLAFPDDLHPRFYDIVSKAIEKDRAARYQTVNQFAADLEVLKKDLEDEAENGLVSRRTQPVKRVLTGGHAGRQTLSGGPIFTRLKSQALSTAGVLLSEIRTHKTAAVFTGATGMLVFLLLIPGVARVINDMFGNTAQPAYTSQPLTNAARSLFAAVSLDGQRVAQVEEFQGKQRVIIGALNTPGTDVVIAPEDGVNYLGLTFSHDNSYLYVTRTEKHGRGILYRVPQPGSTPEKIKEGVESPISFSPQGDQFAFVRFDETKGEYYVMVANVDGSNERTLATRKDGSNFSTYGLSWAPDGSTIVCPAGRWDSGFHIDLVGIDVNTGAERVLGDKDWFSVYQVAWEPDAKALVICAREREATKHQIWRLPFPDGVVQKVTRDLNEYRGVSVARDKIVTIRTERAWQIVVATSGTLLPTTQITTGFGFTYGLAWVKDEVVVHSAMTGERMNIWSVGPDGLNGVQLTKEGDNYNPFASSDGSFVVFSSNMKDKRFNIWRMNPKDGSDLRRLTSTDANFYPSISPDNKWVAYDNMSNTKLSIWKTPVEGGEPIKIADGYRMPVFSPDGRYIAARYDLESGSRDVAIFPAGGGEAVKRFKVPILEWQSVRWIDRNTLSYIDSVNGVSNLWSYDLTTGDTKQLTFFDGDQIAAYSWSQDFQRVVVQRVTNIGDIIKLSSER